jgi:hypothetical protein
MRLVAKRSARLPLLGFKWSALPCAATSRHLFLEKRHKLTLRALAMYHSVTIVWIPLSEFEAADIGVVYAHALGKLRLREPGHDPESLHISPDQATHVLGHERSQTACALNCDAL